MTPEAIAQAAGLLAEVRGGPKAGGAQLRDLPPACRPRSLPEAYAVQDALRDLLARRGFGPQAGWKIGCTTPVMQSYLQIPHPCAGKLYRETVLAGRATLRAGDFFQLGLECEIAVLLSRDLLAAEGGHDADRVAPAVGKIMTSVEIVDHRYADFSAVATPSLVADDFFSWGCLLGEGRNPAELGDLAALTGGFTINGAPPSEAAGTAGRGAAILNHPLNALAWLAGHAESRGRPLQAGQVVTLGSVVKTIYPEAGMAIEAGFDRLPAVSLAIV